MAYIDLPENLPGIRSLLSFRPDTGRLLSEFADLLLRAPNSLLPAERELVATYVSSKNDCTYCQQSHGAIAAQYLGDNEKLVEQVKHDYERAEITPKLKALLHVAGKVARGGREVLPEDISQARSAGASDMEIHDVVLISAAFCMFNRYVDGLGTSAPTEQAPYRIGAELITKRGYLAAVATRRDGD